MTTPPVVTCYRHPDRRAGVTCQRCDRPICPDCMTQGSVGFHCPECVKAASKGAPSYTARTLPTDQPYVAYALIAVNIAAFVALVAGGGSVTDGGGRVWEQGALYGPLVANGEWWRMVTNGFLHNGLIHLLFNMFVLFRVGQSLERRLGHLQFGALYVVSLVTAAFVAVLLNPLSAGVGASGAVFGVLMAAAAYQHRSGINIWQSGLGILIAINIFGSFIPGVSLWNHFGGMVAGGLAGWGMFELEVRRASPALVAAISGGMIAVCALAVLVSPVVVRLVL